MDWNLCVLCQRDGDNLIVPTANLNPDVCEYSVLARNIGAFSNEGLPLPNKLTVSVADLKGDTNIADNLKANKARWHKGYQAELAPSKFKRALESAAKKSVRKNFLKVQMFHPKEHVPASIQLNYNPVSVCFAMNQAPLEQNMQRRNIRSPKRTNE